MSSRHESLSRKYCSKASVIVQLASVSFATAAVMQSSGIGSPELAGGIKSWSCSAPAAAAIAAASAASNDAGDCGGYPMEAPGVENSLAVAAGVPGGAVRSGDAGDAEWPVDIAQH